MKKQVGTCECGFSVQHCKLKLCRDTRKTLKTKDNVIHITHGSSNVHYKGCKYQATTWYLNGFPTGSNLGSTEYNVGEKPTAILYINHHAQPPIIPQHNHSNIYLRV